MNKLIQKDILLMKKKEMSFDDIVSALFDKYGMHTEVTTLIMANSLLINAPREAN